MCGYCGCGETETHSTEHHHEHDSRIIQIEKDILAENQKYADNNRQYFQKNNIASINLMSSPGSGKTTLLVKTIEALQKQINISVIEGDQQTDRDAQKIAATGAKVLQVNTGKACHLDAHRINHAIEDLSPSADSVLFIENVGNLVCPALFDLGEQHKVVILSVTEGEDKPLKYPHMFAESSLMIINKIDLLPYVDFNLEKSIEYAKRVNPKIEVLQTSATKEEGIAHWCDWLLSSLPKP